MLVLSNDEGLHFSTEQERLRKHHPLHKVQTKGLKVGHVGQFVSDKQMKTILV